MTTVTVYGDSGTLTNTLITRLHRQGLGSHLVSTATGWLSAARYAVVCLDTPAGRAALSDLADREADPQASARVVAVRRAEESAEATREQCRRCGRVHEVTLLWHPPVRDGAPEESADGERTVDPATVADAVVDRLTEESNGRPGRVLDEVVVDAAGRLQDRAD